MELANELQAFGCGDLNVEGILLHHQKSIIIFGSHK